MSAVDPVFREANPAQSDTIVKEGMPWEFGAEASVNVVLVLGPGYDALALGGRQLARIYWAIDRQAWAGVGGRGLGCSGTDWVGLEYGVAGINVLGLVEVEIRNLRSIRGTRATAARSSQTKSTELYFTAV